MTGTRLRQDLGVLMASVMAIGSEVFCSCVEEIFVSVVVNTETPGFAVSGVILDLFGRQKGLKIGGGGG